MRPDLEQRLSNPSGQGLPLPEAGVYYLLWGTDSLWLVVDSEGRLTGNGRRSMTRTQGYIHGDELPRSRRWQVYALRVPAEGLIAKTSLGTPRGCAQRHKYHLLRRLLSTHR